MRVLPLWQPNRSSFTAAAAFAACFLLASSGQAPAQGIDIVDDRGDDIADQARASRLQLAGEIAAVDGAALRANLTTTADNDRLARWYAGEVLVDDQWLTLEAAQKQAANDKELSAYRELRQEATDHLKDHELLARWCNRHGLAELANMHWLHVLRFDQKHRPALSELKLTWHEGMLLTQEEAAQVKQRQRSLLKEKRAWRAKAKRLRRDLEQAELETVQAARKELLEIRDPAAVPALLEEFAEPAQSEAATNARRMQLVSVLGGIEGPQATEIIAQLAVESAEDSIRYSAIDQLKSKPLETYVPALLAEMAMPVDASVSINQVGNSIVNHYSYSQDTPYGEYQRDYQTSLTVPCKRYLAADIYRYRQEVKKTVIPGKYHPTFQCSGHLVPAKYVPEHTVVTTSHTREYVKTNYADHPDYQANRQRTMQRSQTSAGAVGSRIAEFNNNLSHQNERIANVLIEVTGETLSAYPKSWWNWWGDYLERHPDVATVGTRQQLNSALLNQQPRGLARGTLIWTRQGKKSVEAVLPGDYVLAQDPRTGELAYIIVIAIATPKQMTVFKVDLSESELHCAPGHVVWTTGSGWQRVSKLIAGQSLHGATAEARIKNVDTAFNIDSYDLIVDRFHTFFVGEQGLLVHDATPIGPTYVALPGFSPAAVADAAQLAANRH